MGSARPNPGSIPPFLTATSKSDTLQRRGFPGSPRHSVVAGIAAVVTWVFPDDERMTTVSEAVKVNPEQRMLIDGKLVEADSGKTFENVNPATEEIIGSVADASTAEMQRAIDSSRRAFDETDWSTNHAFRKRCLEQLDEALHAEQEELRESSSSRWAAPA